MSSVLVLDMARLGGQHVPELLQGSVYGLTATTNADLCSVTGIVGGVVMPYNLYCICNIGHLSIPTGSTRDEATVRLVVHLSSWGTRCEFFLVTTAIVAIGAETVYEEDQADQSRIVDFCIYLAGTGATTCLLFGMVLISAERWLLYAFGMTVFA